MKLHFISGLPRSGSTLLCNILAQNPRFYTSTTSGILDVLFGIRNRWDGLIEFQTIPQADSEAAKLRVLRGALRGYYAHIKKPVVFDKSRGWLAHLEMTEAILNRKVKVLVTVRDIRDVLASFEKLWRQASAVRQISGEAENYFQFQTCEGRCAFWSQADQPVGLGYNRVKDALDRGYGDRIHFVEFEKLTQYPRREMQRVYRFLDEKHYAHDFDNVKQTVFENDRIHGFDNMHTIRPQVKPMEPQYPHILNGVSEKYQGLEVW